MNSKKRNFLIAQAIVVAFVLLITMIINYFLISTFIFNKDTFILITLFILAAGIILFFALSRPLLEPLFESDENLQKALKETIHELNIPVATIDLNAKMLEKSLVDEKAIKRIKRIQKANESLLKLYDDMEYSIKKELEKVDIEEFDLKEIIESSVEKIEDIKENITVVIDVSNKILKSDKRAFSKCIDNLLSNAVKYNLESGEIKISYKNDILSIYNSGKPIDTKNLFIVFDEYFQENSKNEGFGLGLKIVKEYCDKNAISIKIEPSKHGTAFLLNLKTIS